MMNKLFVNHPLFAPLTLNDSKQTLFLMFLYMIELNFLRAAYVRTFHITRLAECKMCLNLIQMIVKITVFAFYWSPFTLLFFMLLNLLS